MLTAQAKQTIVKHTKAMKQDLLLLDEVEEFYDGSFAPHSNDTAYSDKVIEEFCKNLWKVDL